MSVSRQVVEVFVAVALALVVMVPLNLLTIGLGTIPGVVVACMYYFSRYPWGARDASRINERIDAFYDEHLPV